METGDAFPDASIPVVGLCTTLCSLYETLRASGSISFANPCRMVIPGNC